MKLSEILPSVFADGDDPDIQVTTKKYSQFPQANGPGIQGVGLKDGNNVRFDLTTDAIAVNPNITFRDGGEPLYDPDEIANITNQLEVNRFLASELSKLEFAGVEVSSDPPAIITDGQLWYDDDRLELFVSYQDAWISTSPLEARIEAGEALQAEILARVEAGEVKQAEIDDLKVSKKGDTMTGNLAMGGHQITGLGTPKQRGHTVSLGYLEDTLEPLENKINQLEGVVGDHNLVFTMENSNPRSGEFNLKDGAMQVTSTLASADYITLSNTDSNGGIINLDRITEGDVLRFSSVEGQVAELKITDGTEGFYAFTKVSGDLDELTAAAPYDFILLSSFDPAGLATIDYVDAQDSDLQAKIDDKVGKFGGTGNKMEGNFFMGGHYIAGLADPEGNDHAVNRRTMEASTVALTGTNVVDTSWRLKNGGATVLSTATSGKIKIYNLDYPSHPEHAATMGYVDDAVVGKKWKWHQESLNRYSDRQMYYYDVDDTTRQFAISGTPFAGSKIQFIPDLMSENIGAEQMTISGMKDGVKTFIAIVKVRSWQMTNSYIVIRCNKNDFRHWEPEAFEDNDLVTVEYGGLF